MAAAETHESVDDALARTVTALRKATTDETRQRTLRRIDELLDARLALPVQR